MDEDSDSTLRVMALPINPSLPSDFDPAVPPSNGEEYLQRVIWEASKCKQVVVANIDNKKFGKQDFVMPLPGCQQAPDLTMIPTKEWQQCQVADFSSVRQKIGMLRTRCVSPNWICPDSEEGWYKICIGVNQDEKTEDEMFMHATPPLVSYLLNPSMNQHEIEKVLDYNIGWMQSGFSENQARWIYSLLACLELPLTPSLCSTLRSLARECATIRATLNSEHSFLAPLNLIICLVANYFQQTDLAD